MHAQRLGRGGRLLCGSAADTIGFKRYCMSWRVDCVHPTIVRTSSGNHTAGECCPVQKAERQGWRDGSFAEGRLHIISRTCFRVDDGLYFRQNSPVEYGGAGWQSSSSSATCSAPVESVLALMHSNHRSTEFGVMLQLPAASQWTSG